MIKTAEILRSILIWIVALPVFVLGCLFIWIGSLILGTKPFEGLVKNFCRTVLFVCGIRIRVHSRENAVPGSRYVVMMNHVNFFDPLVLAAALPGPARGIEEESHFRWPVYGSTIRRLGMIPICRTDTSRALESLRRAAAWIRERPGFSIAILPEGTRTRSGRLGPFKRGGFFLALETGLDILPVVQTGAFDINRKGSRIIRPGRLDVTILPAVPVSGYDSENIDGLVDRVRKIILDRLGK